MRMLYSALQRSKLESDVKENKEKCEEERAEVSENLQHLQLSSFLAAMYVSFVDFQIED